MNAKKFSVFALSLFAMIFVMSAVSAATLANWNFEDSNLIVDSGTGTLVLSDTRTATFPTGNTPSIVASMSSTGWNVADRYIEIDLSTVGYENLLIKFDERVSGTGPTAFQIQYSSGGSTFINLGSTTTAVSTFATNPMNTFNFSSITAINNNANTKFRIVVPASGVGSDAVGTFVIDNLLIEGTAIPATPSEVITCNSLGNPGSLRIKKIDFTNNGLPSGITFGEDSKWFPFEDIDTTIEVKNDGNDKVNNIEVDWGIWDTRTRQWVITPDNLKDFDLSDGKSKTLSTSFKIDDRMDLDLTDLDGGSHYQFYAIATGEVDNANSSSTCVSRAEDAEIVMESDFVVINNINMPETVQCGETVQATGQLWNVGDNDQDAVSLEVLGRESILKLSQNIDIGDINAFDNKDFSFSFIVPKGLDEKTYALKLSVKDDNGDTYQNDFNDDYAEFTIPFAVKGSCSLEPQVSVLGTIVSGGQAGKPLVVKTTITNTGASTSIYNINAVGFENWASSATLDQSLVSLNAGESKEVLATLNVKEDASGSQSFSVQLSSNGQTITQPVSVSIAEAPKGLFGITGNVLSGNNWYIWGIGLLNLILVIVIIVVAVRIARK